MTENKHSHNSSEISSEKNSQMKIPTIFDAIKSGMLIPVQTIVEMEGVQILKTLDEKGHTPAHWACLGGHTTILRYLMDQGCPVDEPSENDLGSHPIHWACTNGHVSTVDVLLQWGVSVDVTDNKGCTPLISACQYGQTILAGYLIGKGARIHLCDKDGDNALHWAAFKGQSELMRLLIYSGFNPLQVDNYGQAPLHLSCISGNLTAVMELCEQDGADLRQADKNGKSPLMLAKGRKHDKIVLYLNRQLKAQSSLIPKIDLWSIMFGPPGNHKGPIVFFILSMWFWAYPMYAVKCISVTWYDMPELHIIFLLLNVFMWVCLWKCSRMDPGYLPQNTNAYDLAIKEVAHCTDWKQNRNPLSRLCHTCRTVKPIRSKHCKVCNRCVQLFDHHCPYIYNCVGYKNRHWFFFYLTSLFSNFLITLYLTTNTVKREGWHWLYVIGFSEALVFSCIALVVLSFTVYQTFVNLTTNERINRKRYDYLKDGLGHFHNPYDRGYKHNILEFLHLKPLPAEENVHFLQVV